MRIKLVTPNNKLIDYEVDSKFLSSYKVIGGASILEGSQKVPPDFKLSLNGLENIDYKFVIAIDPGTTCTGIVVGNNKIKDSINFGLLIERDSDLDISPDEFTEKVLYFLKNFIPSDKIETVLIESQYTGQYKASSRVLTQYAKRLESFYKKSGLRVISIAPNSWKKYLLEDYRGTGVDLRKSNKDLVKKEALSKFPFLIALKKQDICDAVGILNHYYTETFTGSSKIIKVSKSSAANFRHEIQGWLKPIYSVEEFNENIERLKELSGNELVRKIQQFELNDNISVWRNIRELTSNSNDIFYSITTPTMQNLNAIIDYKHNFKILTKDTNILVVGYRSSLISR